MCYNNPITDPSERFNGRIAMYSTGRLAHCGIMANYRCTAACRHCLYACSPDRSGGYITEETAKRICAVLNRGGCRSVHIGGGEPFMDFEGLLTLVLTVRRAGIKIDYIETNAFWAKDVTAAADKLRRLASAGADTVLISVDPFHAEYVPLERAANLERACIQTRFGYFIWKQQYLNTLAGLDPKSAAPRKTLESHISKDYIYEAALSYGLNFGGRALNIEEEYRGKKPVEALLDGEPCRCLLSTGHFHADMYGRFIPPGCTGFAIPLEEAYGGIEPGRYPAFEALYTGGLEALYALALENGFSPAGGYTSGCALCFYLREHLSGLGGFNELDAEFYTAAKTYY